MGASEFGRLLVEQGSLIALGLLVIVVVLWKQYDGLLNKFNAVQEARIAERDTIVRALADSTRVLSETSIVISRRKGGV